MYRWARFVLCYQANQTLLSVTGAAESGVDFGVTSQLKVAYPPSVPRSVCQYTIVINRTSECSHSLQTLPGSVAGPAHAWILF